MFLFVVAAGVLAAAETSLTNITRARAAALKENDRQGANTLAGLLVNRERVLSPILLLVLTCQLSAATIVGALVQRRFGSSWVPVALVIEVVIFFVIAEAIPKAWALHDPSRAGLAIAPLVQWLVRFPPLRWTTQALLGVAGLFLPKASGRAAVVASEEELLAFASEALEAHVIDENEQQLIESVIDLGDTVVREVMVPRPDMIAVDSRTSVSDAIGVAIGHGFSRVPICGDGVDDIIGIVHVKALVGFERDGKGANPVVDHLTGATYVPETKQADALLREMQASAVHIAIVVDEYGGTAGLVTLEDIIEELIGEIVDEFDHEEPMFETFTGGVRVHGRMPVDELNDIIDAELPEGDWDTVGGLIFNTLGHVPSIGEPLEVAGLHMVVEALHERRITRVRIRQLNGKRLDLEAQKVVSRSPAASSQQNDASASVGKR